MENKAMARRSIKKVPVKPDSETEMFRASTE
jgi:hypothetical protein